MKAESHFDTIKKDFEELHMAEEQVENMKEAIDRAKKENRRDAGKKYIWHKGIAAAAVVFMILPNTSAAVAQTMACIPVVGGLVQVLTIREYQYEDNRNKADIEIPKIIVSDKNGEALEGVMQQSAMEINAEIRKIADDFIKNYEENLEKDWGWQDIIIKSEVIHATEKCFTLKLIGCLASGSGTEWHHYYTIDMTTGERLQLKDLFVHGADYITPISENIKMQMAERMKENENEIYWLNNETEEWNFRKISDETSFYVNENKNVVISFHEGEVAPMYMGVVTFEIPAEVVSTIQK